MNSEDMPNYVHDDLLMERIYNSLKYYRTNAMNVLSYKRRALVRCTIDHQRILMATGKVFGVLQLTFDSKDDISQVMANFLNVLPTALTIINCYLMTS